ncbi:hypothetical protein [Ferrimonas sp. YFM]|uniref:hypothetical protein n=1 Tax=Ferrimonas sp. YFM TaxID=3028878 RepID=UPI002574344E|nr:hypothetical protein [Ferrimonas sp. YFM]BDY05792.1 hypothetical protein F0521_28330 [Ferrimonas sp. YFM]
MPGKWILGLALLFSSHVHSQKLNEMSVTEALEHCTSQWQKRQRLEGCDSHGYKDVFRVHDVEGNDHARFQFYTRTLELNGKPVIRQGIKLVVNCNQCQRTSPEQIAALIGTLPEAVLTAHLNTRVHTQLWSVDGRVADPQATQSNLSGVVKETYGLTRPKDAALALVSQRIQEEYKVLEMHDAQGRLQALYRLSPLDGHSLILDLTDKRISAPTGLQFAADATEMDKLAGLFVSPSYYATPVSQAQGRECSMNFRRCPKTATWQSLVACADEASLEQAQAHLKAFSAGPGTCQ